MECRNAVAIVSLLVCPYLPGAAFPADHSAWQLEQLHQPSAAQLRAEQRGRVVIYDGLGEADVDHAMEHQFERLEHMMFVRTRLADPGDGLEVADDGCD